LAANITQIINDTTLSTTINEQEQIMRISLISNGTNPENEIQNKTDLAENISQITTSLPTEDSSTTTSTTINDQEQIIRISVTSSTTNPIKVENRTSEINLNITANTSQIINDTTMTSEINSNTSSTTINGQEQILRISLISPENETLHLNKPDLYANKSQIIEEETTTLATEDSTTISTTINDQEQIMRISNVTTNTSQITTTTEEETTTTTSEDSSNYSQSNSDNEDSSEEEEDDEEELDDDESPPGFGNNTDFAATLTSTSTAPINLTDDTILYANSSESSSVPVIDWRSKLNNTTTDDKKQTALLRRKNLKVLLEYLKSKDINRLVIDIEMSERYRKVAAALKNTIGLLQTLSIDYKDDK
jgi:hypothetical protein